MSYDPSKRRTTLTQCAENVFLPSRGIVYSCELVELHPQPHVAHIYVSPTQMKVTQPKAERIEWYTPLESHTT